MSWWWFNVKTDIFNNGKYFNYNKIILWINILAQSKVMEWAHKDVHSSFILFSKK